MGERTLNVSARWDEQGRVWWAESADIPGLVTEAATFDALVERITRIAPEIIELNRVVPAEDSYALMLRQAQHEDE